MIHFHIITLFPESIECYFKASMLKRAQEDKHIKVAFYNPRDFTQDKHMRVDRRPYGGGPGMVLEVDSVLRAALKAISRKTDVTVLFFSPSGEQFDTAYAKKLASVPKGKKQKHIVMICGHYEGVDARVVQILKAHEVSVGPFVLTGGELPAALVADAVTRYIPGVLGNETSLEDSRVASPEVYTRPEVFEWKGKKYKVPEVLLSGHHAEIEKWKQGRKTG
jgi:tRNA (guanine37-N1)-methyltransferase